MKTIPLEPQELGLFALVSDEDYARVQGIAWTAFKSSRTYYATGHVPGRGTVLLHRYVMDAPTATIVDHEDHNGLNCQRENLRAATRSQNMANRRSGSRNTSGFRGVSWDARKGKFTAIINCNRQREQLGWFDSPVAAALAYDRRAVELFGEFAMTNARLETLGRLHAPQKVPLFHRPEKLLISFADYERVKSCNWYGNPGHTIYTTVKGRLMALGEFITGRRRFVHRNGNKMDFRRRNLKSVLAPRRSPLPKSGYRGVKDRAGRYQAQIELGGGKVKCLGTFRTALEAATAYNKAATKLHGENAILNSLEFCRAPDPPFVGSGKFL